jgi:hypothetical protein
LNNSLDLAAEFLLDHPPLDELNGSIIDVVERYRYKTLAKSEAVMLLLAEHRKYLISFSDAQRALAEELFEIDQQFAS